METNAEIIKQKVDVLEKELDRYKDALSRYMSALAFMISCARSGETNFDLALQLILNQKKDHNGN